MKKITLLIFSYGSELGSKAKKKSTSFEVLFFLVLSNRYVIILCTKFCQSDRKESELCQLQMILS